MAHHSTGYGHGTDIGCRRSHNEDSYAVLPELDLWVVADGMGGYEGGEIASAIACEVVVDKVKKGFTLQDAITEAHYAIIEAGRQGRGRPGMGTTVVALRRLDDAYEIAWVGDSRAYLWDGTALRQITRDHSYVQQLIDAGTISEKEAERHPQKNVLIQALGAAGHDKIKVDTLKGVQLRNQQILLCSDGLYREVSEPGISAILGREMNVQEKVELLIKAALEHGGSDNITVILIPAGDKAPAKINGRGVVSSDPGGRNAGLSSRHLPVWLIIMVLTALTILVWR